MALKPQPRTRGGDPPREEPKPRGAGSGGGRGAPQPTARPLYQGAKRAKRATTGNAGLWYDKFCDRWKPDWTGFAGESGKRDWIGEIARIGAEAEKIVGDGALIREAAKRLEALAAAQGGLSFQRRTAWRFVTGLGRGHPVENGFAWRHDLGTPFLPGSSLKGLARAYARDWEDVSEKEIARILGPKPEAGLAIGSVAFLDAAPVAPVALEADVMTPHYAPWYQDGEAPGDWQTPTPIPFLAVAPGQTFLFAVLPRDPSKQEDRDDCARAARLLQQALETRGAGAKTAVGYGQFVAPQSAPGAEKRRAATAASPAPKSPAGENWAGREAIVYDELVRIVEDRGDRLRIRFQNGDEDEIARGKAKLR
jgi:CRISPR-associated protein Cmr6